METYTVKKLRAIAKERGIKRYSSDSHNLIDAPAPDISASVTPPQKESTIKSFPNWLTSYVPKQIEKPVKPFPNWLTSNVPKQIKKPNKSLGALKTKVANNHNVIDAPVPDISAPVLTPTKYVAPPQKEVKTDVLSTIKSFADWLISYVPEEIKKPINKSLEALKTEVARLYGEINKFVLYESESAIKGFAKQYTVDGRPGMDATSFLKAVRSLIIDFLKRNKCIKVNLVLWWTMERVIIATGDVITKDIPFVSWTEVNMEATDVNELYTNAVDKMMESMAIFLMGGSGWKFVAVQKLNINTVQYEPLKGSSYISLPKYLADKKAIINTKNEDNQCFKWCLARALNPVVEHSERVTKELRKQAEDLNWNDITFPVPLDEIDKFERNNTDLSINVFGYEDSMKRFVYPLRISKHERKDVVDLLLFSNDSTNHYCLVKT